MRKPISCILIFLLLFSSVLPFSSAEENDGIVAKVITENRGPLKLRESAGRNGRVLDEIPNGMCLLVVSQDDSWCRVIYKEQEGFCKTEFLKFFPDADLSMLTYRVLKTGDRGKDVLALKQRMQELGYIRSAATLTDRYTDETKGRIVLFQRQTGMNEDGIASQELQAFLFSDRAPVCTQTLPRARSGVLSGDDTSRVICGCCMGEGCECCGFTGWIQY